jgi:hypothetical protein
MSLRSKTKLAALLSLVVFFAAVSTVLLGNVSSNMFVVFCLFFVTTLTVVSVSVELVIRNVSASQNGVSLSRVGSSTGSVTHLHKSSNNSAASHTELVVVLQGMQRMILAFGRDLKITEIHVNGLTKYYADQGVGKSVLDFVFRNSNVATETAQNLGFQLKGVFGLGALQWKLTSKMLLKYFVLQT